MSKFPTVERNPAQMPLVDELTEVNTPGVRLLKAKLAHAFRNDRLCPMRKELTSQQPNAPNCHWSADMKDPFIHVGKKTPSEWTTYANTTSPVFNFQSWDMFEFASPPPEIEGVPAINAGENIKLYCKYNVIELQISISLLTYLQLVMDAVGREVMSALKSQRSHCESILEKIATTIPEATLETFDGCLKGGQTPAFYLLQLLLAENVLGRGVDSSELMRRVVQSEIVVLLAKDIPEF